MIFLQILFWLCAAIVAYTCAGYPLLLALVCLFKKDVRALAPFRGSISIVLAARNEEGNLERRLTELGGMLKAGQVVAEILVVSDGSTDGTAALALSHAKSGLVRVLELPIPEGKAAALTAGCESCTSDVLVFADARQRWAPDALTRLLENFAEPRIGAVSGDLHLETEPGVMAGVGLYWRFEKWLRQKESKIDSQVGVTGAISAVRRPLFRPIPAGTLLDDVYWPLQVAMQGHRVVHDPRAIAYDRLPEDPRAEFQRKVRTLTGNFQMLTLLPAALLPWRNALWLQFFSHKLLRLTVPWALIGLLVASFCLDGWAYQAFFWAQVGCYAIAVAGFNKTLGKLPLAGAAASFLGLNIAAFLAFWVWISGRAGRSWRKVSYQKKEENRSVSA